MIRLLIGGSPCTHWSIAQKNGRETAPSGLGWELFQNYLIAKEKFQPDLFLYENNKSASELIKAQISSELGQRIQYINSALVSAQLRQRFYCHNFGDVQPPRDKGVLLKDILESGYGVTKKAYCLCSNYYKGETVSHALKKHNRTLVFEKALEREKKRVYKVENKALQIGNETFDVDLADGLYTSRKLTVAEAARLQTMPDEYCRAVSKTQAYKALGNGWTAEVIIHLLGAALSGVAKDEKIVVLSMYDGIATGRYCLDRLGFHNIEYHATEIDKYAIQISMSNYPDIIQHGDAFALRADDWRL